MKTDVCLVCMPYASVERPSIALGLLENYIQTAGYSCSTLYANMHFAELIGTIGYQAIELSYNEDLLGEWTFAGAAFPAFEPDHDAYFRTFPDTPASFKTGLWTIRNKADEFIDNMVKSILALNPRIVGCTSNFQQNCASLAVLRRIKARRPEVITMMGGANCESEMGQTLVDHFPWLDFAVSGEADGLIVPLVKLLLEKGTNLNAEEIPYGVLRTEEKKEFSPADFFKKPARAIVEDMDTVGAPIYDAYFEMLNVSPIKDYIRPGLVIETARGCWWGAKHHCTFCGLNGNGMDYRSKSPDRVMGEFDNMAQRYGLRNFEVVDNILDMRYINSLMDNFSQKEPPYSIFYETKANLKRDQVRKLAEAGVKWIQPGFESLIDEFLKLIDKGTTSLQNVMTLKWCREYGVRCSWNMLCGAPSESQDWYLELAEKMPLLHHLQPPQGIIKMRYDRFSPYHERAASFGIKLVPYKSYFYVYPLSEEKMKDLAYFFQDKKEVVDGKVLRRTLSYNLPGYNRVHEEITNWSSYFWGSGMPPILCLNERDDGSIRILDSRFIATKRSHELTGMSAAIYLLCEKSATKEKLVKALSKQFNTALTWEDVEPKVEQLMSDALMMKISGRYLALALRGAIPSLTPTFDFPGGHIYNATRKNLLTPKYKEIWTGAL
ncbi:MAG: RiPP maturation radical SAM C-methyltransferase [Bacteroidota bacterium]